MDYTANGHAGTDSKYHITKAIRARVAPPLIGARPQKKQKVFVAYALVVGLLCLDIQHLVVALQDLAEQEAPPR